MVDVRVRNDRQQRGWEEHGEEEVVSTASFSILLDLGVSITWHLTTA